jgi:hypothetical protein
MCIDGRKQICGSSIFESEILVFTLKTERNLHFILIFKMDLEMDIEMDLEMDIEWIWRWIWRWILNGFGDGY